MREEAEGGRMIPMCYVGYRVYKTVGKKLRKDERGLYEGYGTRYDEWVALYSPYIDKYQTRTINGGR